MNDAAKSLGNQPAFPILQDRPFANGDQACCGTTLLTYLIAHAPAEPWPEFAPTVPPRPVPNMPETPVSNDGMAPSEIIKERLTSWRDRGCYAAEVFAKNNPDYSYWILGCAKDMKAIRNHNIACDLARRIQWPRYWAERMLEELTR